MARPQIEFIVQPKSELPSTNYDHIVAYVRDGVDCLDGGVCSQGDEIEVAVSTRLRIGCPLNMKRLNHETRNVLAQRG